MHTTMKNKILTFVTFALAAVGAFAALQKETHRKDDILNTTPIVTDVTFEEDDPVFTNWVGSAEFKNIPRMTSEKYKTEYEPGKTNEGNRTTMYVGNALADREITKDVMVLDMFDVHDRLVIWTPGSSNEVYKCEYVDKAMSDKCDKVDLTSIEPLSPTASTEEIVTAVKALANALGKKD